MRIRPDERQAIADICREEFEETHRRINERLSHLEARQDPNGKGKLEGVRRFYEDLTDNPWTDADEQHLESLADLSEADIKKTMREAYRRSRIHPVPSFVYLMNLLKKGEAEKRNGTDYKVANSDAISAVERERLANLLDKELKAATEEIASKLRLSGTKASIIREQLEVAQGQIIGRFTPLV